MAETKACTICGADLAHKPRVKDQRGRYFCESCHAQAQSDTPARGGSDESASHKGDAGAVPGVEKPGAGGQGRVERGAAGHLGMRRAAPGEAIGLADEGSGSAGENASVESCPDCAMLMRAGADVCVACGFNRKTGRPVGTVFDDGAPASTRRQKVCQKCGYDLAGLRTAQCPECGHLNVPRSKRELMERMPRRVTKWLWITPLIVIGVWACVQVALHAAGVGSVIRGGVFLVGASAIGVPVYWLLNLLWIDRPEPWWAMVLGVVAVYAGGDIVSSLLLASGVPLGGLYWCMFLWPVIIHGFLFKGLEDLEWNEAFASAVPASVIAGVIGFVAIMLAP